MVFIVVDFPKPMVFKEFHSTGGKDEKVFMYLIDPRSSLMQMTA
jgi:hypothetical protein